MSPDPKDPKSPPEPARVSLLPPGMRPGPAGGALRIGNPGNRGPSAKRLRSQFADDGTKLRPLLLAMAEGHRKVKQGKKTVTEPITAREQLYAIEVVLRYGLDVRLQGVDVGEVRERMAATLDLIRELCPPDLAVRLVDRMRAIWSGAAAA